jgi:hypothetical protein
MGYKQGQYHNLRSKTKNSNNVKPWRQNICYFFPTKNCTFLYSYLYYHLATTLVTVEDTSLMKIEIRKSHHHHYMITPSYWKPKIFYSVLNRVTTESTPHVLCCLHLPEIPEFFDSCKTSRDSESLQLWYSTYYAQTH